MNQGLEVGSNFGSYRVVRQLGRGGMGAVWLLQSESGGLLAAKILDPAMSSDHESRRRFLREAEMALGVKHPNLVETYDVGEDPDTGLCYILMEYVPGGTLSGYMKEHGALPIDEAVSVVQAMASVLELGRQKGIVHRDIKPANIMFTADGTPKLADLGIARRGSSGDTVTTLTQTGAMIGTPAYMSPEQMIDSHNVDARADIYSLGVVFYEMLTGERPNKNDTILQLMAKAMKGEPLPDVRILRPEVSSALAKLLASMVAPDKNRRISTPQQIADTIVNLANSGRLISGKARRRKRSRELLVLIATGVATALVMGTAVAVAFKLLAKRPETPSAKNSAAPVTVEPPPGNPPHAEVPVVESVKEDPPERKTDDDEADDERNVLKPFDPTLLTGVNITVAPSCAENAVLVTNWTVEAITELKRQLGAAFEWRLSRTESEILVCGTNELPEIGWVWFAKDYGERYAFGAKKISGFSIVDGWNGFPGESAHGEFLLNVARVASGFHYDALRAENMPIAWGLRNVIGISVARHLGYDAVADKWLRGLQSRAETVAGQRGVAIDDVTMEAKVRPGAALKYPDGKGDYNWIVEYRIAKLFAELMRENPDVVRDYFMVRNSYCRMHGGDARISDVTFAELLGGVTGHNIFKALGIAKASTESASKTKTVAQSAKAEKPKSKSKPKPKQASEPAPKPVLELAPKPVVEAATESKPAAAKRRLPRGEKKSTISFSEARRIRDRDGWNAMRKSAKALFAGWRMCEQVREQVRARQQAGESLGYMREAGPSLCRSDRCVDVLLTRSNGPTLETESPVMIYDNSRLQLSVCSPLSLKVNVLAVASGAYSGEVLHSQSLKDSRWEDVFVDLSEYAGRKVRIMLSVDNFSGFGNVFVAPVYWSNLKLYRQDDE